MNAPTEAGITTQAEIWRPVFGFEGLYEVSNLGRVKSLPRKTASGVLGGGFLSPSLEKNGYLRVTLSVGGASIRKSLHRVVLESFVGECPEGNECRHKDGKRINCALSNLVWGTRSENALDRVLHGTHVDNSGERHGMTHLTDAQAKEIYLLRREGMTLALLAEKFSVSISTVSQISNGITWKHISKEFES